MTLEILILESPVVIKVSVNSASSGITNAVLETSNITRSIKLNSIIDAELL